MTYRLMYRSVDRIPPEDRRVALAALFSTARSNNKERSITGALLVADDHFVQVLEGEEVVVRAVYARIENDRRHTGVTLIESGDVPERVFARWAMAKVSAEKGEPDLPLLAGAGGLRVAAGQATTAEQEAVLDVMRQAARTAPAR
jgi:hypothetical protein